MRILLKDKRLSEEVNLSESSHLCWFDKEDDNRFRTLKITVLIRDRYETEIKTAILRLLLDRDKSFLDLIFTIESFKIVAEEFDRINPNISFDGENWIQFVTYPDEL